MQQGIVVIPKSEKPHRILENSKVKRLVPLFFQFSIYSSYVSDFFLLIAHFS